MKKFFALLLALLMLLSLAACTSGKSDSKGNSGKDTSSMTPADWAAIIEKAIGEGNMATVDVTEDSIFQSVLSELDLAQIESWVAKVSAVPSLNLDTIAVVKCKEGYADTVVDLFNEQFAHKIGYIRQYTFGVAKVEGTRIYKIGDTVMFILAGASADPEASAEDEAKLAAEEYKKIDDAIKEAAGSVPENLAVIKEPEGGGNGGGLIPPKNDDEGDGEKKPILGG